MKVGCKNVMLDAMKPAEDGSGDVIVHLHETARQQADAVLDIPLLGMRVERSFALGQIRAIRISPKDKTAVDVDFIECNLEM